MSALRRNRKIQIAIQLRWQLCLLAVPAALLSALSISVFCHMRAFADVEKYYSGELSGLPVNSLSFGTLLLAAGLWLFYVFAFHAIRGRHLSSAAVALTLAFNMVVSLSMEHSSLRELFLPCGPLGNAIVLLGFAVLIYTCMELIFPGCDYKTRYRIWPDTADSLQIFFGAFACILMLWLPILYCCYPGSVHNDTRCQIMGWLGLVPITASHPILTTMFYGALYRLGNAIGGQEKALFLCLLCQDLAVSAAMGLAALYVSRYTRSKNWFWLAIAFFGLLPVWQSAAQVLHKDVLHTGCFLLFACVYLNCLRRREKSWRSLLLLFLTAVLMAGTRRTAFYAAVICILVIALRHRRTFLLPYLAMLGVFIALFWFSGNVLLPRLGISGAPEAENYSLQFQQVALYCRTCKDEMSIDEIVTVNNTLDYDTIMRDYTPMTSEPVTNAYIDDGTDHAEFWQLYRKMFRRHPTLFIKAAVMGSFEYFNPWFEDISYHVNISREDDFLTVDYRSGLHGTLSRFWVDCLKIPVLRVLIGTGLYAWILLIAIVYSIRKKSGLAFLGLVPSIVIMLGLLVSPVNGDICRGYPLIAAAPLNAAWVLYAVSCRSPENPDAAASPLEEHEPFRFIFRPMTEEELRETEFDPNQPPPELPPEEKAVGDTGKIKRPGPVLRFLTRFIPIPKTPKTYLDVLKVLAIFLVLWNHTDTGFDLYNRVLDMPQHMLYLCFSIFDKIAVPLFFMCSGALLLGREESWRKLLTYRVRRFALILLIVSAINYLQYYNNSSNFSFYDFISRLYTGSVRTPLWYLYAYLAFMLSLPFLRKLARCMRDQDYYWLLGFFIVTQLLSVVDFFWFHGENYHSSDFRFFTSQNYVVYSLWGFYIERVMKKERLNMETLTVLIMVSALSVGATYLLSQWRMAYLHVWTPNNSQAFFNTFIPIPSITVFYFAKLWFSRHPVSERAAARWALLSVGTFGTYLFERFWRDNTKAVYDILYPKLGSFGSSLVHILAACALGIAVSLLYKLVTGIMTAAFQGKKFSAPRPRVVRRESPEPVYTVPTEDISDLEEMETLLVGKHRNQGEVKR